MQPTQVPAEQIPSIFSELPEPRQKNLLWHMLEFMSREEIEWWTIGRAHISCGADLTFRDKRQDSAAETLAILGTDGAYHLKGRNGLACGSPGKSGVIRHRQIFQTFTDGERYAARPQIELAVADRWRLVEREHTWGFTLTDEIIAARFAHPWQRCNDGAWPAFANPKTKLGIIVATLVDKIGADCHICKRSPGTVVDHDHLTNAVRGLLCGDCNGRVEYCTHLFGCKFAEYLNSPPAMEFNLGYPTYRRSVSDKRKEAILGFNINNAPANILDWHWKPKPRSMDGFYPHEYDFRREISTARMITTSARACRCIGANVVPELRLEDWQVPVGTYMGAIQVSWHRTCGGVNGIAYRCAHGCQPTGGWNEPSIWRRSHCRACNFPVCWGCARAPFPNVGMGDGFCETCRADF